LVKLKPYVDLQDGIRIFKSYVEEHELVWHRDKEDREIAVMEGSGWKFQFDDKMPFDLLPGKLFFVPQMTYHRLLKGEGDLTIKIWKV